MTLQDERARFEAWGEGTFMYGFRLERDNEGPAPDVRAMHSALERLRSNFQLLLSGKPVCDVAETLAEVDAALSASQGSTT